MKMGYFGSSESPRTSRNSSFAVFGSTAAFLCLHIEFSSCTFMENHVSDLLLTKKDSYTQDRVFYMMLFYL